MELLRDPIWQFAGVVLAFGAIAVTLLVYVWQRGGRELAFGVISSRALLSVDDEVSGRVSIAMDGVPVRNLHLIVCGLKNSGTQPVLPEDYERPVAISFGDEAKILILQTTKEYPKNIVTSASSNGNCVEFAKVLLNPGDYAVVQVLLSAETPKVSADCRIVGITQLVELNKPSAFPYITLKSYMVTALQVLIVGAVTWPFFTLDYPPEAVDRLERFLPWIVVFFIGITLSHWAASRIFNPRSRRIDNP